MHSDSVSCCTLSSVNWSGYLKYMAGPFFYFYMKDPLVKIQTFVNYLENVWYD